MIAKHQRTMGAARRKVERLLLALTFAGALLSGCGSQDPGNAVVEGDTEGIWVDVGPLDYHIQGSRQLNPAQVPDDRYLSGVPEGEAPTADEIWFAVFLRIENKTDKPALSAEEFEIEDTQGKKFEPLEVDTEVNPFAYEPYELGVNEVMPHPDSVQEFNVNGAMLLFKLPLTTIADRPLQFHIKAPPGQAEPADAEVDLDV